MDEWKRELEKKLNVKVFCEAMGIRPTSDNGRAVRAMCPIHKGDNPSGFTFTYNDGGRHMRWICSSGNCGYGDLISLVMKIKNLDFRDAMEFLCDMVGASMRDLSGMFKMERDDSYHIDDIRKFNEDMRGFREISDRPRPQYVSPFINEEFVKDCTRRRNNYFTNRGFPVELQELFEVGFCPIHLSPWNRTKYPARVTIPLRDINRNLVGISGRVIKDGVQVDDKYNILPGSRKAEILYGYYMTAPYIQKLKQVVIVEGFADMWRCWQYGVMNAVALMAKETSWEQHRMLVSIANKFIIGVDNDKWGRKGGDKLERRYRMIGTTVRLMPPPGRDIGSLGREEFNNLFKDVEKIT